ncbi:hypothetical protein D3C84_246460 [compost metagenome]
MRAAAHGATVDFRQGEGRTLRRHDYIGGAGDADATAEDEAVHGDYHRHRAAVYGLEGFVVAGVDRDDALRVGIQFLDVDAGTEAAPLGANDDDPHLRVDAQCLNVFRQCQPFLAVQGVDGWLGEHQLGNARVDLCSKCLAHDGSLQ